MRPRSFRFVRLALRVGVGGIYIGGALIFGTVLLTDLDTPLTENTLFAGVTVGILALAILFFGVRCPQCGAKPFAESARLRPPGSLMHSVMSLKSCPKCGLTS